MPSFVTWIILFWLMSHLRGQLRKLSPCAPPNMICFYHIRSPVSGWLGKAFLWQGICWVEDKCSVGTVLLFLPFFLHLQKLFQFFNPLFSQFLTVLHLQILYANFACHKCIYFLQHQHRFCSRCQFNIGWTVWISPQTFLFSVSCQVKV